MKSVRIQSCSIEMSYGGAQEAPARRLASNHSNVKRVQKLP
jgi:hypothetical protein